MGIVAWSEGKRAFLKHQLQSIKTDDVAIEISHIVQHVGSAIERKRVGRFINPQAVETGIEVSKNLLGVAANKARATKQRSSCLAGGQCANVQKHIHSGIVDPVAGKVDVAFVGQAPLV